MVLNRCKLSAAAWGEQVAVVEKTLSILKIRSLTMENILKTIGKDTFSTSILTRNSEADTKVVDDYVSSRLRRVYKYNLVSLRFVRILRII
jgi:hypothetical protein